MQKVFTKTLRCKISVILLTFFMPVFLSAQFKIQSGDVIYIEADQNDDIYTILKTAHSADLDWAGKLTGVTKQYIMDYHALMSKKTKIKSGSTIIPVNKGYIISNPNFKKWKHAYLAVKYRVKKGETLYTIARNYLGTSEDFVVALNKKSGYGVRDGEELTLGWMLLPVESPSDMRKDKKEIALEKNTVNQLPDKTASGQKDAQQEVPVKQINEVIQPQLRDEPRVEVEINVIGIWDKNGSTSGNYIEAYNPMLKRNIKAKVIGRIPVGTYAPEVQLILNPSAARELGLLDVRFKAIVKYQVKE
jgi:LysM repeat protein